MRPVRRPYPRIVEIVRAFVGPLGMRDPRDIDALALAHAAGARFIMPAAKVRGEGHTLRARDANGPKHALVAIAASIWGTLHGRFVLGHETGHLLAHADHDVLPVFMGSAPLAAGARKIEAEATDAGCELLMPEAWFAPACRGAAPGLGELRAMAARFQVDLTAAALRALLYVEQPCAVVVAKGGIVDWVACSEGWDVYLRRKRPLPEGSAAAAVAGNGARGGATGAGERGIACAARVWGERASADGAEERAPVSGELREFVDVDASSRVVTAWLVRA
jgi:hypothetical protein